MVFQLFRAGYQLRLFTKQIDLVLFFEAEMLNGVARKNYIYAGIDNLPAGIPISCSFCTRTSSTVGGSGSGSGSGGAGGT